MMGRQGSAPASGENRLAGLVARIGNGDQEALAQLYDSACSVVYGMALRIVRQTAAAEDVTLEVFLQVWRTAAAYDAARTSVISWLAMMARSRSIDWLRSAQGRFARLIQPLENPADSPAGGPSGRIDQPDESAPDPEQAYAESERTRVVRQSMLRLSADQRQAIELAFFSGLSHSEIAERLGQPLGTVKSRIRTGMLEMRESLAGYTGGGL